METEESISSEALVLDEVEQFLLGQIDASQLPLPLFQIHLHGRLSMQRELEETQAALRHFGALDAAPPRFDTRALEALSALELAVRRGDPGLVVRALRQKRRNETFGREVA